MTRQEAIVWYRDITSGSGVDRNEFPIESRGRLAQMAWDDGVFTLGTEYGVLIALRKIFDITDEV